MGLFAKVVALLALFVSLSIVVSCSDDDSDADMDSGPDTDADADTDTDADADTDTDTDTGEDETPPNLPALCTAQLSNNVVSGDGDGQWPTLAAGTSLLALWTYDETEYPDPEVWQIQTARLDTDAGISESTPMTPHSVATMPVVAAKAGVFGAVWLDSRWDTSCDGSDPDGCALDLAFMRFDSSGQPYNSVPERITVSENVATRPSIAATDDGWLVTWLREGSSTSNLCTVYALALAEDGTPSTPQMISEEESADSHGASSVAALGTSAAVVWRAYGQEELLFRALNTDGSPGGETVTVDEGLKITAPSIAAGDGEYLVAWSRQNYEDYEAYTILLSSAGASQGEPNRATWNTENVSNVIPAWNGTEYAIAWHCARGNGDSECWDSSCQDQVFVTALDQDGAPVSQELRLSDNPNPSTNAVFAWDGAGWRALWELRQNLRQQIFQGRAICDIDQ